VNRQMAALLQVILLGFIAIIFLATILIRHQSKFQSPVHKWDN